MQSLFFSQLIPASLFTNSKFRILTFFFSLTTCYYCYFIPQVGRNGDQKGVRENPGRIRQAMHLQYPGADNGRRNIAEAGRNERLHLEERVQRRHSKYRPIGIASG